MLAARRWLLSGKVQGVGFRPFVYRLALSSGICGWVRNNLGQVEIQAQASEQQLTRFERDLIEQAPMIAQPRLVLSEALELAQDPVLESFKIFPSGESSQPDIHIPPDYFTCPECLEELQEPKARRYQYPFINCTQCGPRYTLIEALPYDRPLTSMAEFPLCDDCLQEYENPLDRRFHAEPLACSECGPHLYYRSPELQLDNSASALATCVKVLKAGEIVLLKGIGGYHLICDAGNHQTVAKLRKRKGRPDKPLAVMFPARGTDELDAVRESLTLSNEEAELLRSPARPIVLLGKRASAKADNPSLCCLIAPGLGEVGAMLPYSPLHYLLLAALGKPLVTTSANISGEPVLTEQTQVEQRLKHISQHYLHHNRRIVRPADDSVYRRIAGRLRPIRLGRGSAPLEMELPFHLDKPILACGGHMKNAVALAWDNRLVVSPHIGELDSPRSLEVFEQTIDDLQRLYQVKASLLVCDQHPDYASTRWAQAQKLPQLKIQHHRAHASALALERWNDQPWLIFCWDGSGYALESDSNSELKESGEKNSGRLWGGEAFYGRPGNWQRVASFKDFKLPGGDKAGREPWRSAAALCWQSGYEWAGLPDDSGLLKKAWKLGVNSPSSSSAGRLFDAASALIGLVQNVSFEAQGPMLLEQQSESLFTTEALPLDYFDADNSVGFWRADWADLLPDLLTDKKTPAARAAQFQSRLAATLLKQVEVIAKQYPLAQVGLCGGVFQNRKLSDYVCAQLERCGYSVFMPQSLPLNDAGISAGQIAEAASMLKSDKI